MQPVGFIPPSLSKLSLGSPWLSPQRGQNFHEGDTSLSQNMHFNLVIPYHCTTITDEEMLTVWQAPAL
jgi:hypothetical protein